MFCILDANDGTFKWMEDKARLGQPLPRNNFYAIVDKIRGPMVDGAGPGGEWERRFQELEVPKSADGGGRGQATIDAFRTVLKEAGFVFDNSASGMSEQELITITRGNGNRLKTFDYTKILEQLVSPTDEFK
jgi:hypothetical protein